MWYIVLISETLLAKPVKKYISCHISGDEAKSEFLFKTRNFNVQTRRFGTVFDGWAKIIAIYFAADNISTAVCKTPYIVLHCVNGYENHAVMRKRTKKNKTALVDFAAAVRPRSTGLLGEREKAEFFAALITARSPIIDVCGDLDVLKARRPRSNAIYP